MPRFFSPFVIFFLFQTIPMLVWLLLSSDAVYFVLQGYAIKANGSFLYFSIFFMSVTSFLAGTKLSYAVALHSSRLPRSRLSEIDALTVRFIFFSAAALTFATVLYILFSSGITLDQVTGAARSSQGNQFKESLYGGEVVSEWFIIFRHLIFSAMISYYALKGQIAGARTIKIVVFGCAIFLFFVSSSRLVVIGVIAIIALFYFREQKLAVSPLRITIFGALGLGVFAAGVMYRSAATWETHLQTSSWPLIVFGEFLAYYISPINYSVAIVDNNVILGYGNLDMALIYILNFVYSVLNIDVSDAATLHIGPYYNSSLTQIGLLGQFYSSFGPGCLLMYLLYGFLANLSYRAFCLGSLVGLFTYPLVFISLLDSTRGFLLSQNIIMANLIYFFFCYYLIRILAARRVKRRGAV